VENSSANDICKYTQSIPEGFPRPADTQQVLISQAILQGTARPTRYCTLLDENDLSADDFQRMTNNICWTYARATKAVCLVVSNLNGLKPVSEAES